MRPFPEGSWAAPGVGSAVGAYDIVEEVEREGEALREHGEEKVLHGRSKQTLGSYFALGPA